MRGRICLFYEWNRFCNKQISHWNITEVKNWIKRRHWQNIDNANNLFLERDINTNVTLTIQIFYHATVFIWTELDGYLASRVAYWGQMVTNYFTLLTSYANSLEHYIVAKCISPVHSWYGKWNMLCPTFKCSGCLQIYNSTFLYWRQSTKSASNLWLKNVWDINSLDTNNHSLRILCRGHPNINLNLYK